MSLTQALPTSGVVVRLLPPEEWTQLTTFEPFASGGLPVADQWRILVAEAEGAIVGFCCVFAAAHLEPWYIAPSHRRNPAVGRGLVRAGRDLLRALDIGAAFAVVSDEQPEQQAIVERLGFTPAPGKLYVIAVEDLEEI